MKVNSKISLALFIPLSVMVSSAAADINSLISNEVSRTVSQEVNKNLADKMIEAQKPDTPFLDKKLFAKSEIKKAQQLLQSLGFKPGTADGLMGKNTRKAIRNFQKSQVIKVDGVLTESLLHKLNIVKSTE